VAPKPCLAGYSHDGPPWDPISGLGAADRGAAAQRSWRGRPAAEATERARLLQNSSRRKYLGVILSPRDWVTYLYLPLFLLLFAVTPYFAYKSWHLMRVSSRLTSAIAETRHDYRTLLGLIKDGPVAPWQGMPFTDVDHLDSLFAEQGLDIIADTRIADMRSAKPTTASGRGTSRTYVYVYRYVSVRKLQHCEGTTGLRLQWEMPAITVRCHNPELNPELRRCAVTADGEQEKRYVWQVKLDFQKVPVGSTTDVIVEAILPAEQDVRQGLERPWWRFEVDADPEVVTSWLLLPDHLANRQPCLIRYQNSKPDIFEFVEPTHSSAILNGRILNWTVVHPKADYTYSYRWNSGL
jgi:hypothetical protein